MEEGTIGVLLIFFIVMMWQIFSVNLNARIRYVMIGLILLADVCFVLFSKLRRTGGMLLVFWGVVSVAFLLAEYVPKTRGTRQRILVRRETISMPEDYLFNVGVAMMGIEVWLRTTI